MAEKKRKVLVPQTNLKAGEEPEKVKFVVRPGRTFGVNRLRQGREVELTVAEALPLSDILEPADRNSVLPKLATPQELADAGYEQVANPTAASTDRDVMTPEQRAYTSAINPETGQGVEPTAGGDIGDAGGRKAGTTSKKEK